ncbi:MAG: hypothetical protein KDK70_06195 [Myxococcales bacterium]|nr:hypothetical protein [Myxococcales bacterium]
MRGARSLLVLLLSSLGLGGCIIITNDDDGSGDTAAADEGTGIADDTGPSSCFDPPQCDPLASNCAQSKCVPDGSTFACTPTMPGMEELGPGEPCSGSVSCQEGLLCLPGGGSCTGGQGCCVPLCDVSQPQCPSGTVCMPYFSGTTLCYDDVGVCVVG